MELNVEEKNKQGKKGLIKISIMRKVKENGEERERSSLMEFNQNTERSPFDPQKTHYRT